MVDFFLSFYSFTFDVIVRLCVCFFFVFTYGFYFHFCFMSAFSFSSLCFFILTVRKISSFGLFLSNFWPYLWDSSFIHFAYDFFSFCALFLLISLSFILSLWLSISYQNWFFSCLNRLDFTFVLKKKYELLFRFIVCFFLFILAYFFFVLRQVGK